mgnify:CR=1 FL=1
MNITVESTSDVRRRVHLVVPAGDVSRIYKAVLAKVGGRAKIKGFRPGKAPRKLLERRFGPVIREEVLERVLSKSIPAAIDDQKLEPMGQPELDEIGELRDGEDLTLSFSVEVLPVLDLKGWQGADLVVPTCEADDEDMDAALKEIAETHASVDDVEGEAAEGDQIAANYTLGDEGEPTERRFVVGGEGQEAWVEGVIATAKAGAEFEVPEYTKTDESDARPEPQTIKGVIMSVKRRNVPAIDDALAKADGRFETLDALKAHLEADQQTLATRSTENWKRNAALDHVLEHNSFDVPKVLVEREVDHRLASTFGPQALQKGGQLASLLGELRTSMRVEAKDQVRRALIIRHVIDTTDIEVSEEQVDAQIDKMLSEMKDLPEKSILQLKSEDGRRQSKEMLQQEGALDALLAEVTITAGDVLHLRDPAPAPKQSAADEAEDQDHDHDHDHAHSEEGHVHGPNCDHDH